MSRKQPTKIKSIICKEIDDGSYGVVFVANNIQYEGPDGATIAKKVAVKKHNVPSNMSFFVSCREMDILNKLRHDNIISLLAVCDQSKYTGTLKDESISCRCDSKCFEFEYAENDNLYKYMCKRIDSKEPYFSYDEIAVMSAQMLSGLDYMHRNDYIHLDIKTQNILVMGDGSLKICDFGFSKKYFENDRVLTGISSPYFRPPEYFLHKPISEKFDIWSCGCVIFYVISKGMFLPELIGMDPKKIEEGTSDYELEFQHIIDSVPQEICKEMLGLKENDDTPFAFLIRNRNRPSIKEISDTSHVEMTRDQLAYYFTLLSRHMLNVSQKNRLSARQILQGSFISASKQAKQIAKKSIAYTDSDTSLYDKENKLSNQLDTPIRKIMSKLALSLFTDYRREGYYTDRALFMAIDIFDRISEVLTQKSSEEDIKFLFRVCFHLAYKYHVQPGFSSGYYKYDNITLGELKPKSIKDAEKMENKILQLICNELYNSNLFEEYLSEKSFGERLEMDEIYSMLLFTLNGLAFGLKDEVLVPLTPKGAYKKWAQNKDKYVKKATVNSYWYRVQGERIKL